MADACQIPAADPREASHTHSTTHFISLRLSHTTTTYTAQYTSRLAGIPRIAPIVAESHIATARYPLGTFGTESDAVTVEARREGGETTASEGQRQQTAHQSEGHKPICNCTKEARFARGSPITSEGLNLAPLAQSNLRQDTDIDHRTFDDDAARSLRQLPLPCRCRPSSCRQCILTGETGV